MLNMERVAKDVNPEWRR